MAKEEDIKEALLKQMDGYSVETTDVLSTSARNIIEKHKARLRRRRWIAVISWLITLAYAVAMHNVKIYVLKYSIEDVLTSSEFWLIRYSDMTMIVMIIISFLLTFLAYAKSKTLAMLQICARLASIEEHLKRMSEEGSTCKP